MAINVATRIQILGDTRKITHAKDNAVNELWSTSSHKDNSNKFVIVQGGVILVLVALARDGREGSNCDND